MIRALFCRKKEKPNPCLPKGQIDGTSRSERPQARGSKRAAQHSVAGPGAVVNGTRFPVSQSIVCFSLALIAPCTTRVLENLKGQKVQHVRLRFGSLCPWAKDIWFGAKLTNIHACVHTQSHTPLSLTACFEELLPPLQLPISSPSAIPCPFSPTLIPEAEEHLEPHLDRHALSRFLWLFPPNGQRSTSCSFCPFCIFHVVVAGL